MPIRVGCPDDDKAGHHLRTNRSDRSAANRARRSPVGGAAREAGHPVLIDGLSLGRDGPERQVRPRGTHVSFEVYTLRRPLDCHHETGRIGVRTILLLSRRRHSVPVDPLRVIADICIKCKVLPCAPLLAREMDALTRRLENNGELGGLRTCLRLSQCHRWKAEPEKSRDKKGTEYEEVGVLRVA